MYRPHPSTHENYRQRCREIEAEPLPPSIDALLDLAAEEAPSQPAWHFTESGESLTYTALRERVSRLAEGLRDVGVGRGTHVAVMLPNVPEMPLTWLALARIGAVMVPVNLRYTGTELLYMLEDSDADMLVIHHTALKVLESLARMPASLSERIYVVGSTADRYCKWEALESLGADRPLSASAESLDSLVNLQYTSGTTGFPKGCMLTHGYWLTCAKTYGAIDGIAWRRLFADNPFFYMTPQWLLLMAFFHRATLYVAPRLSGSSFSRLVREHGIEFCLFRDIYMREPARTEDADNRLRRMNIYPHRKDEQTAMEARFRCPVRPAFGMTEIGAGMIMPLEADAMVGSGSCGIAAPFRECRIADERGETVADGTPGELLIRGAGLFLGYYKKPEATRAAFHGDWFRTGDVAVRDAFGFFTIVGRLKDMIKRAGENVAAAEVEAVLERIPGVAEAAAIGVPDPLRGEEIKACLVLAPGRSSRDIEPDHVLRHCAQSLAPFKLPRFIDYRSRPLPRTASGKIAKQTLRDEAPHHPERWERSDNQWRQIA